MAIIGAMAAGRNDERRPVARSHASAIVWAAHGGPPHEWDIPIWDYWAIQLDAGRPQSGEAVAINRTLPVEKFLDRQHIAAAGLFEREEPAANGCNHFGLATITQRVVPGAGRSASVSGLPSGAITCFLGR